MLAVLYDIHGNLAALEAVLADVRSAGADRLLLGGDYAMFGPFPAETVAALRALSDATWIRGNVERWCAHPEDAPDERVRGAVADCRRELGAPVVAELGRLPELAVVDGILYCHASPVSDVRSFTPDPDEDEDELLDDVRQRRVVFGHTHLQFRRVRPDGIELINPGSVGMPLDGDHRAAYLIVHDDGKIELRRVAYDHATAVAALRERFGDRTWVQWSSGRMERAGP